MGSLQGKVALVTGGSRGIGAAIVRRLAREGATVAFTYVSSEEPARRIAEAVERAGGRARAYRVDSADPVAVERIVDEVAAEHGRLDVLVSNAGVATFKPVEETTLEDFDRIVATNLRSVFAGARAAARHLRTGGRIITIGSANDERVPFPGVSAYAASKAALVGLTKGLARDLGPRGISVTLVSPGPIDTDMNPASGPLASTVLPMLALPRYGTGDEVAGLVAYLASDESAFVTGVSLAIDGGITA
ncbi:short-chain dehydrogenase/reductase SDR [Anaeromyxobacter sp. K]|uniref:3-oxoacyl-ACP reductase family protein n=1 Tax=Anaeromyxobacter sp. (strain K) TaxID=447217 RepID=UPI00015F9F90|nr:3-oxoacyl-ACP reductase family protein [Anaeromyxobacter sp. K]ACG74465.1 short-chain dehydrogenase/reductase SDR [Anaeromyxobacter sp. K]